MGQTSRSWIISGACLKRASHQRRCSDTLSNEHLLRAHAQRDGAKICTIHAGSKNISVRDKGSMFHRISHLSTLHINPNEATTPRKSCEIEGFKPLPPIAFSRVSNFMISRAHSCAWNVIAAPHLNKADVRPLVGSIHGNLRHPLYPRLSAKGTTFDKEMTHDEYHSKQSGTTRKGLCRT